jgi:hypothetical protein
MDENVKIPLLLLRRILCLLNCLDISGYHSSVRDNYDDILWMLEGKMCKLKLRESYAQLIRAETPDAKHEARIRYLQKKREYSEKYDPPF